MQAARFYVPAIGAISLLGAWLITRAPRRAPVAAVTSAAVAVMFGTGFWSYNHIRPAMPSGTRIVGHLPPGKTRPRPHGHNRPPRSPRANEPGRQQRHGVT